MRLKLVYMIKLNTINFKIVFYGFLFCLSIFLINVSDAYAAQLVSPAPGSTLSSSTVIFIWDWEYDPNYSNSYERLAYFAVGTPTQNYYCLESTNNSVFDIPNCKHEAYRDSGQLTPRNSVTVNGLPTNGEKINVALATEIFVCFKFNDGGTCVDNGYVYVEKGYEYTAFGGESEEPESESYFRANPTVVDYGGSTTLEWNVPGADKCDKIWGFGTNWKDGGTEIKGSKKVSGLTRDNIPFLLKCTDHGEIIDKLVSVSVDLEPRFKKFTANPTEVDYGGSTTLSWKVENAQTCIKSSNWRPSEDKDRPSGSIEKKGLTERTQFELGCSNPRGKIYYQYETVFCSRRTGRDH